MKVATPEQMNEIDSITINRIGIPGIVLMENAAVKVVDEVARTLGNVSGRNIAVIAGKGNNGGDAFAAARHLINRGACVKVFVASCRNSIAGDAAVNLHVLENMGVSINELTDASQMNEFANTLNAADLILDGIFGTGFKGEVRGLIKDIIEIVNNSGKTIISIDIPSGVCGTGGKTTGCCVHANKTVTFVLPKTGLVIHPGCDYTGELVVADIGVPSTVVDGMGISLNIIDGYEVCAFIPQRFKNSNKGDYGKLLIISGSIGMTGSGALAAGAALRTGAGLVYLGVPSRLASIYDILLRESVTIPLKDKEPGCLSVKCIDEILALMKKMDVLAIGPGLSLNDDVVDIVSAVIETADIPLILDADALNAVAKDISILRKLRSEAVITPHPGEMARLCGISIEEVQNNRIDAAREFAGKWRIVTVLKGSRTIIALPDGTTYINPTGNSGMATAGSGDVLAGVIAGLAAQGAKLADAAVVGVYLHGLAGDNAAIIKGEHGLVAGDIIDELPKTIKQCISRR